MRIAPIFSVMIASLSLSTSAFSQTGEGRKLAELAFQSVDSAERGYIDLGEFSVFGDDVFISMDSDDSGELSLKEFPSWGFGMELVAEETGRMDALETAKRVVFSFWDLNGDNVVSKESVFVVATLP
ncbi:MAG: hypothetical protein ACPGVK_08365 [Halocynthiibacter sp.]